MKTNRRSRYQCLAFLQGLLLLLLVNSAAALTWDADTGTAGAQDGSGLWAGANWWDGAGNVTWDGTGTALFGAGTDGTYEINVAGLPSPAAQTIRFSNSGYTLTNDTAETLILSGTAAQLSVDSAKTATIGTNVIIELPGAGGQFLYISGSTVGAVAAGTLNIENGATVRCTAASGSVIIDGVGTVVNVKPGGTLTGSGISVMSVGASAGADCALNIQGGTWSSTSDDVGAALFIGQRGVGTVTLSSGVVSAKAANTKYGLYLAQRNAGGGTFNLDGGTLYVPVIKKGAGTGGAFFNFNGGTLQALANSTIFMQGLNSATVKSGGAIIDDGGFAISIAQALLAGTPSGGLTKLGSGTLTLTGTNTYSGVTTVSNGTLLATSVGTGSVEVKAGAALGAGSDNSAATLAVGGNLTLADSVLLFDIVSSLSADKITVAGNLTLNGVTTITLPNATPLANGNYTLLEVTGTLGGSAGNFTVASQSPKTYSIVYQSGSPNRVVLQVSGPVASKSWVGDGGANQWDIGTSLNWLESGSTGPLMTYAENDVVNFYDSGTNRNVNLTTVVSPASVTVNSTNNYTFSGAGGIAGTNTLIKNGVTPFSQGTNNTSRLTLATANSYSGGTILLGSGALILSNSAALGTGPLALQASRLGSAATVFLAGGITVTNPILMDATTSREAITSTNGNNTLAGSITISGAAANTLIFSSLGGPGSLFAISNSITASGGWVNTLGLRGTEFNSGLISGQITINSMIQVLGSANWTICSTNNTWTEARISQGVGGFILGAENAMATNALVRWDSDSSGALDLAGFNQTIAGLYCTSTTSNPPPSVINSSLTSDSLLKIKGNNYTFVGALLDGGTRKLSLELLSGTQTLKGVNTYSGPTTISGGTLVLNTTGSILNSPRISVASGANFDVTTVNGGFVLDTAQTLAGNGNVLGAVTVNGTLAPGDSIGTLTFNSDLTLQGTTVMEIARNDAVLGSDLVAGVGTLNYGGTLIVTNIGSSPLQVGDVFQLFSAAAYNPAFANIIYPAGYTFTDNLSVDGSVTVLTAPTAAPALSYTASGGNWVFNWAESGFKLQTQTNALSLGLGTNWVDVPGGDVSGVSVPGPNAGNPAVFFRLISTP